jgi:hypothetical protein
MANPKIRTSAAACFAILFAFLAVTLVIEPGCTGGRTAPVTGGPTSSGGSTAAPSPVPANPAPPDTAPPPPAPTRGAAQDFARTPPTTPPGR